MNYTCAVLAGLWAHTVYSVAMKLRSSPCTTIGYFILGSNDVSFVFGNVNVKQTQNWHLHTLHIKMFQDRWSKLSAHTFEWQCCQLSVLKLIHNTV